MYHSAPINPLLRPYCVRLRLAAVQGRGKLICPSVSLCRILGVYLLLPFPPRLTLIVFFFCFVFFLFFLRAHFPPRPLPHPPLSFDQESMRSA